MKKFTENDVFVNTIKVYPKVRFFATEGQVYYNDTNKSGIEIGDFLIQRDVYIITENRFFLITEIGDKLITETPSS